MTVRPVAEVRAIGSAIEVWGTAEGDSRRSDLPWRGTRDPWAVLVSEILAQQTQLARVVPAYHRFLAEFPTPAACASAPLGDVLRAWHGMGYNRRAKYLHSAARAIVAEHGGVVPADLASLLALPGVGPYTARAILAFAFERDVGVVDTNAGRVIARGVAGRPVRPGEAQTLVDSMVPVGRGWSFGQALLDLGATVCTSRTPDCRSCPIRRRCRWASACKPDPDPAQGSAGVSVAQRRFAGSDRQGRGRLIAALRNGPIPAEAAAGAAGWPGEPERTGRVVEGLVAEGLVVADENGDLGLP